MARVLNTRIAFLTTCTMASYHSLVSAANVVLRSPETPVDECRVVTFMRDGSQIRRAAWDIPNTEETSVAVGRFKWARIRVRNVGEDASYDLSAGAFPSLLAAFHIRAELGGPPESPYVVRYLGMEAAPDSPAVASAVLHEELLYLKHNKSRYRVLQKIMKKWDGSRLTLRALMGSTMRSPDGCLWMGDTRSDIYRKTEPPRVTRGMCTCLTWPESPREVQDLAKHPRLPDDVVHLEQIILAPRKTVERWRQNKDGAHLCCPEYLQLYTTNTNPCMLTAMVDTGASAAVLHKALVKQTIVHFPVLSVQAIVPTPLTAMLEEAMRVYSAVALALMPGGDDTMRVRGCMPVDKVDRAVLEIVNGQTAVVVEDARVHRRLLYVLDIAENTTVFTLPYIWHKAAPGLFGLLSIGDGLTPIREALTVPPEAAFDFAAPVDGVDCFTFPPGMDAVERTKAYSTRRHARCSHPLGQEEDECHVTATRGPGLTLARLAETCSGVSLLKLQWRVVDARARVVPVMQGIRSLCIHDAEYMDVPMLAALAAVTYTHPVQQVVFYGDPLSTASLRLLGTPMHDFVTALNLEIDGDPFFLGEEQMEDAMEDISEFGVGEAEWNGKRVDPASMTGIVQRARARCHGKLPFFITTTRGQASALNMACARIYADGSDERVARGAVQSLHAPQTAEPSWAHPPRIFVGCIARATRSSACVTEGHRYRVLDMFVCAATRHTSRDRWVPVQSSKRAHEEDTWMPKGGTPVDFIGEYSSDAVRSALIRAQKGDEEVCTELPRALFAVLQPVGSEDTVVVCEADMFPLEETLVHGDACALIDSHNAGYAPDVALVVGGRGARFLEFCHVAVAAKRTDGKFIVFGDSDTVLRVISTHPESVPGIVYYLMKNALGNWCE